MLVDVVNDNMNLRLEDEFKYLANKYKHIAFNMKDWSGKPNNNADYLFATEGYITIPENYDFNVIKKYKGLLTHNRKFYNENKDKINIILTPGNVDLHNYYRLDTYISYEEKIDGIVGLNRIYHTGMPGDIIYMREPIVASIPWPIKHTYGPYPWAGNAYQGKIEANHPNHINNLIITNKYKFVLTLESTYHELWSYDWITERLWNAFKSKTIPIYYGCYNIEDKVPVDLFIDLRKYIDKYDVLSKILKSYSKQQYIDQTEKAFEWYETNKPCKTSDFEQPTAPIK
jgi:hypothetical protein